MCCEEKFISWWHPNAVPHWCCQFLKFLFLYSKRNPQIDMSCLPWHVCFPESKSSMYVVLESMTSQSQTSNKDIKPKMATIWPLRPRMNLWRARLITPQRVSNALDNRKVASLPRTPCRSSFLYRGGGGAIAFTLSAFDYTLSSFYYKVIISLLLAYIKVFHDVFHVFLACCIA